MPYVTCHHRALTAYTAARWTTVDDCPTCHAPLPRRPTAPPTPHRDAAGLTPPPDGIRHH